MTRSSHFAVHRYLYPIGRSQRVRSFDPTTRPTTSIGWPRAHTTIYGTLCGSDQSRDQLIIRPPASQCIRGLQLLRLGDLWRHKLNHLHHHHHHHHGWATVCTVVLRLRTIRWSTIIGHSFHFTWWNLSFSGHSTVNTIVGDGDMKIGTLKCADEQSTSLSIGIRWCTDKWGYFAKQFLSGYGHVHLPVSATAANRREEKFLSGTNSYHSSTVYYHCSWHCCVWCSTTAFPHINAHNSGVLCCVHSETCHVVCVLILEM